MATTWQWSFHLISRTTPDWTDLWIPSPNLPLLHQIKVKTSKTVTFLKRDSNTGFFLWHLRNFKNMLLYRTSPVASESFQSATLLKKRLRQKMYFCEFCKICKKIFSFDRTPPNDDCFLCLSVDFEKFFRILFLRSTSGKLLVNVQFQNFNRQIQ